MAQFFFSKFLRATGRDPSSWPMTMKTLVLSLSAPLLLATSLIACSASPSQPSSADEHVSARSGLRLDVVEPTVLAGEFALEDNVLAFEVVRDGSMLRLDVQDERGDLLFVVAEAEPTVEGSMAGPRLRLRGEETELGELGFLTPDDRARLGRQDWSALEQLSVAVEDATATEDSGANGLGRALTLTVEQLENELPEEAAFFPTCSKCYQADSYTWWIHACFLLPCAY